MIPLGVECNLTLPRLKAALGGELASLTSTPINMRKVAGNSGVDPNVLETLRNQAR